jgi:hypothetical protein
MQETSIERPKMIAARALLNCMLRNPRRGGGVVCSGNPFQGDALMPVYSDSNGKSDMCMSMCLARYLAVSNYTVESISPTCKSAHHKHFTFLHAIYPPFP